MIEVWKDVFLYEGLYRVSSEGRVKSLDHVVNCLSKTGTPCTKKIRGRILKPGLNANGYPIVILSKKGVHKTWPIHRLVGAAFLGVRSSSTHLDHINGNRKDSRLCNLRVVTRSENMRNPVTRMKFVKYFVDGLPLKDYCITHSLKYDNIIMRIHRGLSVSDAITLTSKQIRERRRKCINC